MWRTTGMASVFLACATAASAASLSEAQIKSQILDKMLDWSSAWDHRTGTAVFKSDGNFFATLKENSIVSEDSGQWLMKDSKICLKWSLIFMRSRGCFTFWEKGSGTYVTNDGIVWMAK